MDSGIWVALAAGVPSTILAINTVMARRSAERAAERSAENTRRLAETKAMIESLALNVDGRLTELLVSKEHAAHLAGAAEADVASSARAADVALASAKVLAIANESRQS